jgi:voltage-gated potassium channel
MKTIYDWFESNSVVSRIINKAVAILIFVNVFAVILDSYNGIDRALRISLNYFEAISIIIFSIEYVLRIISSPYKYDKKYRIQNIFRYAFTPLALIDLFSIVPFYIPLIIPMDLRFIRILRIFRLIRILKIKRYSKSIDLITKVFVKKRTDLIMVLIVIGVLILMSGSVMYYVENELQPEVFPNIIDSSLWSLRTMVFLGYDEPPLTLCGKIIGLLTTLLGLGWIAMPISIISSGFIEEIDKRRCK